MSHKALVVLSGGQDSTTCLFWAIWKYGKENVHAITFNYGQRHAREINAAIAIAGIAGLLPDSPSAASTVPSHVIVSLGQVLCGTSPLVSNNPVGHYESAEKLPGGIEPTFVPCRNMLFLTIAANRAIVLGCDRIVTGVCQEDFGGYPDCRRVFIDSMEQSIYLANEGAAKTITIDTPLMNLSKAESVRLAASLDGCLDALAHSHTCYDGQYPPNPNNHASILRARGFADAGIPDPLITRAKSEGLLPADYPDSGLVAGTKYAHS